YLEKGKNLLWCLPLIMIVWVNCHGGFLIGLGIIPVVVVCEVISSYSKKKETKYLLALISWMILTGASVLVNPYGYDLMVFLYKTLSLPRSIGEWNPVCIFDLSYFRFKLLAILVILALFIQRKKNRYWEIGIIGIAMLYAFSHERHTPIFAIVAVCFVTEKFSILGNRIDISNRTKSYVSKVIISICVLALVGYQTFHAVDKYIRAEFNILVGPDIFPVSAVRFLKENRVKGNVLLPFEWGEYVIWKLYPDCKVSIDGRFRTVYPEEVLDDHLAGLYDESRFMEVLIKYPTDIILARRNPLFQRLIATHKEWIYAYSDPISIIFVKEEDSQQKVIERLKRKEMVYPNKGLSVYFP
ncbi:hypothetical protein KA005_39550, partial [bacterium]|nr:hypothetical protein [bacterium]